MFTTIIKLQYQNRQIATKQMRPSYSAGLNLVNHGMEEDCKRIRHKTLTADVDNKKTSTEDTARTEDSQLILLTPSSLSMHASRPQLS